MEKELPKGWAECKLGDFAFLKNGYAFKSSEYKDSGTPVLRISDIKYGNVTAINSVKILEKPLHNNFIVEKGDILIAMSGATTGKFGVYSSSKKAFQNQRVGNFKPYNESYINKRFLYYLLFSAKREIEQIAYGGAQPNISSTKIENITTLLAPLNEQKRIVDKIEELFSELDKGVESLKTAREQLKIYRQSILKNAFEGKLTEQWREENKDKLEPAEKIPFSEYCEMSQNGLSKRSGKEGKMIPVIRLADINNEELNFSDLREIRLNESELSKYKLHPNDLLCIRVNGSPQLVGRIILIKDAKDLAFCDHFIRFKINKKAIASFLKYFFNTRDARRYIDLNKVSSAGQNTVSQKTLGDIEIPHFSIEEQEEIVKEIESKFSVIDKLEKEIEENLLKAETLRQSILKKAFSGKLVEQDPNDEPASILLDRIRKEKESQKATSKTSTLKPKKARAG